MEIAMINDEILPIQTAKISAHDRGLFFGDGVYEVVISRQGRIFAWDRHLNRLRRSLHEMHMLQKVDLNLIENRLRHAIEHANIDDAVIYFHLTRGAQTRAHDWPDDWQPNFLLTLRQNTHRHPTQCRAISHPDWRWKRCDIKSLNLLANVLAKHAATQAHAYEAILVDEKGLVTEGTATSVLIVRDGCLQTAPLSANILPGITRALLLEHAHQLGLEPREQSFSLAQALAAPELLLTGTTAEVIAVTELNGQTIAAGQPGPYADRLRTLLQNLIVGYPA
jgi:D-alanine transaminase